MVVAGGQDVRAGLDRGVLSREPSASRLRVVLARVFLPIGLAFLPCGMLALPLGEEILLAFAHGPEG
jgi:hypothetical protein